MIVRITADRQLRLDDAEDFRKFAIQVDGPEADFRHVKGAFPRVVMLDDASHGWVFISALRSWPGFDVRQDWQDKLSAMIKAAEPHGWIDRDRQAIKAHVVWAQS